MSRSSAAAVDLDPPQLEAALDRRREDEPPAVRHPVQPGGTAAEQVAVHGGGGLEVRPGDEVLGQPVPNAEPPDRCLVDHAALPVADADGGDPAAVRRPGRRAPRLPAASRRQLAHAPGGDVDEVDVRPPAEVRVAVPVGDERDPPSIRRPARVGVVAVAPGQQLGVAGGHVDEPQVLELVVDEPAAVELVEEGVDEPRVGRRRILGLALGLLLRLGGCRAADHAQPTTVRRPGQPIGVLRQVGQLAGLSAIREREEPDLRAAFGRSLGLARLGTAATGLQHAAAIRQEGERPTVRAPARRGVGLAADGQLAGRAGAVGRRDPERAAVAVLARRHRLDAEGDPAPVGREADDRSGRGGRRDPRGAARVRPSVRDGLPGWLASRGQPVGRGAFRSLRSTGSRARRTSATPVPVLDASAWMIASVRYRSCSAAIRALSRSASSVPKIADQRPPWAYQFVAVEVSISPTDASQRSASMAALQPSPAAVTAWR